MSEAKNRTVTNEASEQASAEDFTAGILAWTAELAPEGIFTTDRQLHIRTWNAWLEQHTRLPANQVIGKSLSEVIPSLRERRLDHYYRDALNGESKLLSRSLHGFLVPIRRTGTDPGFANMQQSARIGPLVLHGKIIGTITSIRDVTEREWQALVLRQARLRSELLAQTLARLITARDPDRLISELYNQISPALQLDCCIHHLLEPHSQRMQLHSSFGLTQAQQLQCSLLQVGQDLCGTVLLTKEQLVINNLQKRTDPGTLACRQLGLRAFASFPLLIGSRLLGSLAFGTRNRDTFSDEDVRFLFTVSQYAAVALDRSYKVNLLRASEERFRNMADTVPDIIFTANPDGSRDYLNSRFTEATGLPTEAGLGFGWMQALDPRDVERVRQRWAHSAETTDRYRVEYRMFNASGQSRWYYARARPILDSENRVIKWFGTVTDIHDLKMAHEELSKAQAELAHHAASLELTVGERTSELRETITQLESFSYTVAHDLRAPIRSLESFASILLEDYGHVLDADGRTMLKNMGNAARRLDALTRDVLTYTRVSAQKTELAPVDIPELVEDLLVMNPSFQPPSAMIALVRPMPLVLGNKTLLSQCLSNLLSNAVKFVKPGTTPHIVISAERVMPHAQDTTKVPESDPDTTMNEHVRIWVQDNGIGIEPGAVRKIFGIFERGRGTGSIPGTGIGLAIVARAARRMGGTYGVESVPGEGSRFWLELPAASPEPSKPS